MAINVCVVRSYTHRVGIVIALKSALDNADAQKRFFVVWTN